MIDIDDKVTILKGKYIGYNFRVIKIITDAETQKKSYRLVRLFKNEKLGETIYYSVEPLSNVKLVKKNPKYLEKAKLKRDILSIEL